MDDRSQKILDNLPQRRARSRLAPYRELIHELRRRRRTYREIARVLAERCQCKVSISTLHDFIRTRSRSRRESTQAMSAESGVSTGWSPAESTAIQVEKKLERHRDLFDVGIQRRIAALKRRPAPAKSTRSRFQYDPDEPLHLRPKVGKDRNSE